MNPYDKIARLLEKAQKGDEAAIHQLMEQFEPLIQKQAMHFSHPSSESMCSLEQEDWAQEARFALYQAIQQAKPSQYQAFSKFALRCVSNHLIDHARRIGRPAQQILTESIRFDDSYLKEGARTLSMEQCPGESDTILDDMIAIDMKAQIQLFVEHEIQGIEQAVFRAYLQGSSIDEIAENQQLSKIQVQNALYRVRQKLRKKLSASPSIEDR